MGRPPSNGGPSFRFNPTEVVEMEAILQAHKTQVPSREVLVALADKFSSSGDRAGKVTVQMKQVWNWFQNRRYAIRAKASRNPVKSSPSPALPNLPQVPQFMSKSVTPSQATVRSLPQALLPISSASVPSAGQNTSDNLLMEYEARSARDGAWYDVATFISHRSVETTDPEVLVRFAGLGPEEDEWVNIRKHVRQRSLPCEASECVAVCQADLILCFQEGKDQALYYDAHVLDAQRRRHDVRGCRCRFLVRYDHDQSEEIVPLKKVCRRPETDYRMQQLAEPGNINGNKVNLENHSGNTVTPSSSEKLLKAETKEQFKAEVQASTQPVLPPITNTNASAITNTNASVTTAALTNSVYAANPASVVAPTAQPTASVVTTTIPISQSTVSGTTFPPVSTSNPAVFSGDLGATVTTAATATVADSITSGTNLSAAGSTNQVAQAIVSEANLFTESSTDPAVHSIDSGATLSPTGAQATSGATPFAVSATNEAVPVCSSQATAPTNEAVQVSDSEVTAISVSDSQATASGNEAAPVSDSLATTSLTEAVRVSESLDTASSTEAIPVSNSLATASSTEAVPVSDSQAAALMNEAFSVGGSQAPGSMNEAVPVSDYQDAVSMNEAIPVNDSQSQADVSMNAIPVSDSQAAASVNETVPVSDSQADVTMNEAIPVSDSQADVIMNEDVPVTDSQANVSTDEAIPVTDDVSMNEAVPVSDSQANVSMNETVPVSDSQANVSMNEAAAVTDSQANGSMSEAIPVNDSQATASATASATAVPVRDFQATTSANEAVPAGDYQATASINEVVPIGESQATDNTVTPEATLSPAIASSEAVQLIDSGDIAPTVTAAPIVDSLNSGASASPTSQTHAAIQLGDSEASAEATLSAAGTTTPAVQPIDSEPTVPAVNSVTPITSPTTQDANGTADSAVTTSADVPNLSATDSAVTTTITTPVSSPGNEAGASDSVLPATTADSDDLAVADTTSAAGDGTSQVPETADSMATEED